MSDLPLFVPYSVNHVIGPTKMLLAWLKCNDILHWL